MSQFAKLRQQESLAMAAVSEASASTASSAAPPIQDLPTSLLKRSMHAQKGAEEYCMVHGTITEHTPVHKVQMATLDPTVIGCTGFSIATVLMGCMKLGIFDPASYYDVAFYGFFMGGLLQVYAGHLEMLNGSHFGAWAFSTFGWNWAATGISIFIGSNGPTDPTMMSLGIVKSMWFVLFVGCLFVLTFKISIFHIVMIGFIELLFIFEVVSFAVGGSASVDVAAGVCAIIGGMMGGALAFIVAFNAVWGKEVLSIGKFKEKAE